MSIAIYCPDCNRKYIVTDKHIGKKVVCADASCGRSFIATADTPSDSELDFTYDPSDVEVIKKERHESPPPTLPKTASQSVVETDSELREQIDDEPRGNPWRKPKQPFDQSPYPNLNLYLWVVTLVFKVQLIICLIIGGLCGVATIALFTQSQRPDVLGGGILITLGLVVPAIVLYVVSMAGVEFVRVIVDLRNDTKQTTEHLAALRSELAVRR